MTNTISSAPERGSGVGTDGVAWMRMMGRDSVAYHRATVMERADDHPGAALAYYADRGESPLLWGGAGADELGLAGAVSDGAFSALYGEGGAADPGSGRRLVKTRRPGMELVVGAHKSVAVLGVIGRAEDVHSIMDAERDATLAYLDQVAQEIGGRRGTAGVRVETSGLIYAHSRHATSRAGDPAPHDHVLIANVVRMHDERGGWKAIDMTVVRDHLHAATMVGRLASARRAIELGYEIEPDRGRSGRLGHWRLRAIDPKIEVLFSKRSAEINDAVDALGTESYAARAVAARATRSSKRHQPVRNSSGSGSGNFGSWDGNTTCSTGN